jgi:hypothetical protein
MFSDPKKFSQYIGGVKKSFDSLIKDSSERSNLKCLFFSVK